MTIGVGNVSGVRGNLAGLQHLIEGLKELSNPSFRGQLADNMAADALEMTMQCFDAGTDPYGAAWAPLKQERQRNLKAGGRRGSKVLKSTGNLKNSIAITSVSYNGFHIGTGMVYAAVHQFGHAFAAREQAAIRIKPGTIMFVALGNWSYQMGRAKWRKVLQRATNSKWGRTATLPISIDKVSRVFYVEVAPVIPPRPFLPTDGLPPAWRESFNETYRDAVKALLT